MKKAIIYLSLTSFISISLYGTSECGATELVLRLNSAPQGVFSPTETLKAENESLLDQLEVRELLMAQEISRRDEQLEKLNQTSAFMS